MTLRSATEEDADMVLPWRNHPKVRGVSVGTDVIPRGDHVRWWTAMLHDPDRLALIYEERGLPAGVAVFSGLTGQAPPEWSYYLDIEGLDARGHTLAAWLNSEREILDRAFGPMQLTELEGVVLASNAAMLHLHERFGCTRVGISSVRQTGEFASPHPVELVRIRVTPETRKR